MTWEEYKRQRLQINKYVDHQHYMQTEIECPTCGMPIYKNVSLVLTSYPPQYQFRCMNCGWTDSCQ